MSDQITQGIHQYKQLMGLIHDPNPLVWRKWWIDESDVRMALGAIVTAAHMSQPFVDVRKTRGRDYDFNASIKRDTYMLLTFGKTSGETATLEKQYKAAYYLIIEPTIDLITAATPRDYPLHAQRVVENVCTQFDACTEYGTYDQAVVAQGQVQDLIQQRESVRLAEKAKNKPKPKARDLLAELFASISDEDMMDE